MRATTLTALLLPLATAAHAQVSVGSTSSELDHRIHYDVEYKVTGTGDSARYSSVLIILVKGQVDSLRPPIDSAGMRREQAAGADASRHFFHASATIPFNGHWYWVGITDDSVTVLGHWYHRAGGDSTVIVMLDHGDHVGGDPSVTTIATTRRLPKLFWTLAAEPQRRGVLFTNWLRTTLARDFVAP